VDTFNDFDCLLIREYFPSKTNPRSSTWIFDQALYISQHGFKPLVVSPTPYVPKILKKIFPYKYQWQTTASNEIENYCGIKVLRLKYIKLPQKYFTHYNIKTISKILIKYCKQYKIYFIHAHFGQAGIASIPLKRKLSVPLITSFYGFDLGSNLSKLKKGYISLAKEGHLFLALSEDMKKDLVKLSFPRDKIIIHHLGVDVDKYCPGYFGKNNILGKCTFLIVARFEERKGIHFAIDAFQTVSSFFCNSNITLRIVGDGPFKNEIIKHIGDNKQIILFNNFITNDPEAVVINEMQNCDVFVLTSQTMPDGDKEGTPIVLMEAQACGKPCISTYHAGIPEVVINNETGILVKEKDINAIFKAMLFFIQNTDRRIEMGQKAREHIINEFNLRCQMVKLINIYNRYLLINKI